MSRRIDIELTSRTDDGFTWRAAGAKQPRGVVAASLVPDGTGAGATVRAEIESGIEGVEVVAVLAAPQKADNGAPNRIEVLGAPRRGPDVSVSYASGGRRRRPDGEGADRRRERPGRHEGTGRRPGAPRADGEGGRGERPVREGAARREERPERPARAGAERGGAPRRPAAGASTGGPRAAAPDDRGRPGARRERKAPVSTEHRNAMLGALGPQELPVAEQLLRGGIPAVRQALAEQRASRGPTAGPANDEAVLAIAEQLLPRVSLASWKDRAAAAQALGKELRLRELRAVVTASRTVTLDEEARATAKALREQLDQRVEALRADWQHRMTKALDEHRVADAVRVSARPPEPSTRVPAEVAVRLADAAGEAMTAASEPEAWLAILDAVVESPVRRTVKPRGIPEAPEAKEAARRAAGSVPELAKLLGLPIPPPPPPRRVPPGGGGRRVMAAGGAGPAAGH